MRNPKGVYIGIGSNIEPFSSIRESLALLQEKCLIKKLSFFYKTPPIGRKDQPEYVNGCVYIETSLSAEELKKFLLSIEEKLGRKRGEDKYAPRKMDLDILVYKKERIPSLKIPSPEIQERYFIAYLLYEINPYLEIPYIGKIQKILQSFPSKTPMELLLEFSLQMKRLFEPS